MEGSRFPSKCSPAQKPAIIVRYTGDNCKLVYNHRLPKHCNQSESVCTDVRNLSVTPCFSIGASFQVLENDSTILKAWLAVTCVIGQHITLNHQIITKTLHVITNWTSFGCKLNEVSCCFATVKLHRRWELTVSGHRPGPCL